MREREREPVWALQKLELVLPLQPNLTLVHPATKPTPKQKKKRLQGKDKEDARERGCSLCKRA
jgi:hypothetical protein